MHVHIDGSGRPGWNDAGDRRTDQTSALPRPPDRYQSGSRPVSDGKASREQLLRDPATETRLGGAAPLSDLTVPRRDFSADGTLCGTLMAGLYVGTFPGAPNH